MFGMELSTIGIIGGMIALLFWLMPEVMQQFATLGLMVGILVIILIGWEKVGEWLIGKLIK